MVTAIETGAAGRAGIDPSHVRRPMISEVEVKGSIKGALIRSAELDADRIRVHAEGGRVTLTGVVRSWTEKQEANSAAWRARGVTAVTNEIEVRPFQNQI
jgi:osmotically-inducible protein OsmY